MPAFLHSSVRHLALLAPLLLLQQQRGTLGLEKKLPHFAAREAAQQQRPCDTPPAAPQLIPLTKESIPVKRNGEVVAFKTSYSGAISVGRPAQDFRVVFDTGSAHIVLPSVNCLNETCLMHRQYNMSKSETALAINADGSPVPPDELCDQVTIGYGTGKVTGEFVREQVCPDGETTACVEVTVVMAVEMTAQPFRSFNFDGIFGLALDALAISPEFSFFNRLAASGTGLNAQLQFGVFLTEDEGGSEIALGGFNQKRLLTPLKWAPVAKQALGYWQVEIKEVRIGNQTLDLCHDGSCRGVVDTGTSHFGIPASHITEFQNSLTTDSIPDRSCREVPGEELQLVLEGFTLTLTPEDYMRPLPIPKNLNLGSQKGVTMPPLKGEATHTGAADSANAIAVATPTTTATSDVALRESTDEAGPRSCSPRLMPVNLPSPLGPKLFILGEPVLQRYYTVYDWKEKKIGFGLSATNRNRKALPMHDQGHEGDEEIYSFMQVTVTLSIRRV